MGTKEDGSSISSLLETLLTLDKSSSALSTIAVAVAALSCEVSGIALEAFDMTDSGDGSLAKEDIGVASDIKAMLNSSKLVGSAKGKSESELESITEIPEIIGNFREAAKNLHSVTRMVMNSGKKVAGKALLLGFELQNLGKSSLNRTILNLSSAGIDDLKTLFGKSCPSVESCIEKSSSSSSKDYVKLLDEVNELLKIVWKIVAWEALTAFFALEGGELLNQKDAQVVSEGEAKPEKKKKKKKAVLRKGTGVFLEVIKDWLNAQREGAGNSGLLERLAEGLGLFVDLESSEFNALLQKVKDILESNESRRIPKTPKGTRDFAKDQMIIRKRAFSTITRVFEKHCATALDTPAFELRETLMGKYGEDSKLVYDLADQGGELCCLRYDLTVPFARYVAMNGLTSFKRYHIDKVWRRDNPSKGRYREFYQCDFDIAGQFEKMGPDFEVVKVLTEVLDALNIGDYEIKLNHRKLLDGVLEICGVPPEKFRTICSSIDKLDKLSFEQVKKEMVEQKGLSVETADRIGTFVSIRGRPLELLSELMNHEGNVGSELLQHDASKEALGDLKILFEALDKSRCINRVVFDLSLARGLDYYTGVIFEAAFKGGVQVGSIGAGGRYDNLIGNFGSKQVPAVGMSLGIERVLTIMEDQAQKKNQTQLTETQVLVAVLETQLPIATELVSELWDADIKAEFKIHKKFMKLVEYAEKSGIPWMVIVGGEELSKGIVKLRKVSNEELNEKEEEIPRSEIVKKLLEKLN